MRMTTGFVLGFLILMLSCTTCWADPIVGDILLNNVLAPANGLPGGDNILVLNTTGGNGADVIDSLTFSNVTLTINGTSTSLGDISAGNFDLFPADGVTLIPTNTITGLSFAATIGSSPFLATLTDGSQVLITQYITAFYTGLALDSSTNPIIPINVAIESAAPLPEPATIFLLGIGFVGLWIRKRRQA